MFAGASYFSFSATVSMFPLRARIAMTKRKVLLIGLAIIILGIFQVAHWYNQGGRAAGMGKASGMVALLSGVGIALYGLSLKEKK